MAEEPVASPDLDEVVARLQARVAERRRSGVYPPGLEEGLEEHFRRIGAHRAAVDPAGLQARLAALDATARFDAAQIHAGSQRPGGAALHRGVALLVARQTQGALDQVQGYADAVRHVLAGMAAALEDPFHVHADLVEQLDAVLERLAAAERRAVVAEAALAALADRVGQLEASDPAAR